MPVISAIATVVRFWRRKARIRSRITAPNPARRPLRSTRAVHKSLSVPNLAGGAPGISAPLEADRDTGWVVVVLANLDPPAAESLGKGIRRLLDAVRR